LSKARGLVAVLGDGVARLVDSGCLQMAGGEMRGCFVRSRQVLPSFVEAAGAAVIRERGWGHHRCRQGLQPMIFGRERDAVG